MPSGGSRKNAGRKRTKISGDIPDKSFAARVLARIGELGLRDPVSGRTIKDLEDYALHLLAYADVRVRKETFLDLVNRSYGRAPLAVQHSGEVDQNHSGEVKVTVEFLGGA
jgi:hypothetical protein